MDRRASRNAKFLATGLLAATGGAIAAIRRSKRAQGEVPINAIGGRQRRWQWQNNEIFVTELGAGPPILLIHGIYAGASSYEFRKLAPILAREYRVIALDFLGCGLSDRPNIAYTSDTFIDQLVCAIDELTDEPLALVASSLGAAFAIRAALRREERVKAIVAIQPTGVEHQDGVSQSLRSASEALIRTPLVGEGMFNALTAQASLRHFLRRVYSSSAFVDTEVLAHYTAMTRVPGGRFVTAAFVGGSLSCDVASDLPFLTTPILMLWGAKAAIGSSLAKAQEYQTIGNNIQLRVYPECGALPHEEDPATTACDVARFVGRSALKAALSEA